MFYIITIGEEEFVVTSKKKLLDFLTTRCSAVIEEKKVSKDRTTYMREYMRPYLKKYRAGKKESE